MEMRATDYCKYAEKQNKEEIISRHVITCIFLYFLLLMIVNDIHMSTIVFFFHSVILEKSSVFALYLIIVTVV